MTFKADVAKWLMTQRPGVVTIDDVQAALGASRDLSGGTLARLTLEPAYSARLVRIGNGTYQWTPDLSRTVRAPRRSPARRLTAQEEETGAKLYAEGRTEREVAEALNCSNSTAHRLYERLEAERKPVKPAQPPQQLPLAETLTVTIQPDYFTMPGRNSEFRHFRADDGRTGTLWFHKEIK